MSTQCALEYANDFNARGLLIIMVFTFLIILTGTILTTQGSHKLHIRDRAVEKVTYLVGISWKTLLLMI